MTAIITEKFRLHNATQFFESFSEAAANKYYMLIGKATPFTSGTSGGTDSLPPTPVDDVSSEFYVWDQTIAGKNISSTDISRVLPRRDWNLTPQHLTCMMIRLVHQTQQHLEQQTFMTQPFSSELQIIECTRSLDNNGGTAYSGSEPTSESTSPFASGGYILKYMYAITASQQTKFLTTDFMSQYR